MANWRALAKRLALLDRRIDERETRIIVEHLLDDGKIDMTEFEFIFELRKEADFVSPQFDRFVFRVLKKFIIADGCITSGATASLEKWFTYGKPASASEKAFLAELRKDATSIAPEFQVLCDRLL